MPTPRTIIAAILLLCASRALAQHAAEGEMAPDFTVTTMEGKEIALSKLRGSVVVINFWFIGCPPCREEIPGLNKVVEEFKGKNVVFVAPANDRKTALEKFLKKQPFAYDIIPAAGGLAGLYEVIGFPTHLVIGTDGKIVKRILGGGDVIPMVLRTVIAGLVDSQ